MRLFVPCICALACIGANGCPGSDPLSAESENAQYARVSAAGTVFRIDDNCDTYEPLERLALIGVELGAPMTADTLIDLSQSVLPGGTCVQPQHTVRYSRALDEHTGMKITVGYPPEQSPHRLEAAECLLTNGLAIGVDTDLDYGGTVLVRDYFTAYASLCSLNFPWLAQPPVETESECQPDVLGGGIVLATGATVGPFSDIDYPTDAPALLGHFNPTDAPDEIGEARHIELEIFDTWDECVIIVYGDIPQPDGLSIEMIAPGPIPAMPAWALGALFVGMLAAAKCALDRRAEGGE